MFAASKTASVSGGYQISRSLRFNSADSAYLNRTPASATNRRTWTWSAWVKRSALGTVQELFDGYWANTDNGYFWVGFTSADAFEVQLYNSTLRTTTQVFRDPSAWYHFVLAVDTTQATAANRVKVYLNGSEITTFSTNNAPTQNLDTAVNYNGAHYIGTFSGTTNLFNGYMTEVNLIDGTQLTPSSFGQTDAQTGVWTPIAYSGSYGTNGFYLNFSDNSNTTAATLGKDYSGNGNNWTPNNFSVTAGAGNDSLVDSPTSYGTDTGVGGTVRGNYATLNPLIKPVGTVAYSNGNLDATNSTSNWNAIGGTIGISTGKWYWEYISGGQNTFFGIQVPSINFSSGNPQDSNAAAGSVLLCDDNQYQIDYNARVAYTSTSHPSGTVVGVAVDMDAGTIVFYLNGTSQGSITWTSSAAYGKTVIPMAIAYNSGYVTTANFGQRPFAYTAPSGFKALCTQNLPTPTIGATTATQAGKFFNPVLYTGNGTARSITGVGFQPDLTWIKLRDTNSSNGLFDAVRGATKRLVSDTTAAEDTISGVTSFDSDGFSLGTSYNGSSFLYVAWNWKASGSTVTNTAGSITSTVSANTTSGFSVVTYGGNGANSTIGHGIGTAPSMVIVKRRGAADAWIVYHASLGNTNLMVLNSTAAVSTSSAYWNNTSPTSTVFTVGTATEVNANGSTYVAYCFAEVAGYSKFGSYTGNGSADGPFVFTGMRPAYIMVKRTDTGGANMNWIIWDATRNTTNVVGEEIYANLNDAGTTYTDLDFVSNGFKIRNSTTWYNASGGTYIFMAFAQNPFKYSLAR